MNKEECLLDESMYGHSDKVKRILEKRLFYTPPDVDCLVYNSLTGEKQTPLLAAIKKDNAETVAELIRHGAKLHVMQKSGMDMNGFSSGEVTPLTEAIRGRHFSCIQAMWSNGAALFKKKENIFDIISLAVEFGDYDLFIAAVKQLPENERGVKFDSCLSKHAIDSGNQKILDWIVENRLFVLNKEDSLTWYNKPIMRRDVHSIDFLAQQRKVANVFSISDLLEVSSDVASYLLKHSEDKTLRHELNELSSLQGINEYIELEKNLILFRWRKEIDAIVSLKCAKETYPNEASLAEILMIMERLENKEEKAKVLVDGTNYIRSYKTIWLDFENYETKFIRIRKHDRQGFKYSYKIDE